MNSCTSRMSISWRQSNASSIAILVGDVMAFMFKVAILIDAIRRGMGEGPTMVSVLCPYEVALLSFSSSSVLVVF